MPYKPRQQRAIAADMQRRGKSRGEISEFFHRHGHGGKGHARREALRRMRKRKHR